MRVQFTGAVRPAAYDLDDHFPRRKRELYEHRQNNEKITINVRTDATDIRRTAGEYDICVVYRQYK